MHYTTIDAPRGVKILEDIIEGFNKRFGEGTHITELREGHGRQPCGYQYDGRTSGAPDFRSLLHKQGCLRTKEWLEFVSRLVQNSCICTFRKDGGEMNLTINTAFCDDQWFLCTLSMN